MSTANTIESPEDDILTTQVATRTNTSAPQAAREDDDEDAVDFGDEGLMTDDRLKKLGPSQDSGNTSRINLANDLVPMQKAWLHYLPNKKGTLRCLTKRDKTGRVISEPAICCQKAEKIADEKERKNAVAKLVIVTMGVEYTNVLPKTGLYAEGGVPVEFKIGFVKLSRYAYREITAMINTEESEKVSDFDILIGPDKKGGIGWSYNRVVSKHGSKIRHDKKVWPQVVEAFQSYLDGKDLKRLLGKKVSDVEMAAAWAGANANTGATGSATGATAQIDNVEDIN